MPTFSQQPAQDQLISAYGECAELCFDVSDALLTAGTKSKIEIDVNTTDQTDGDTFIIAGQTFTVLSAITDNTATAANLTMGTVAEKAGRIAAMLQSNPAFSGTTISILSNMVTVEWNTRGANPVTPTSFAGLTDPYTFTAMLGTDNILTEGYEIAYDVEVNGVSTGIQTVSLNFDENGVPISSLCIDANYSVRPYLKAIFYGFYISYPIQDMYAMANVRVKGQMIKRDGCSIVYQPAFYSNYFRVLNSAVQEEDRDRLDPYNNKFLSRRPFFCVCPDSIDFLYFNLNTNYPNALDDYNVLYEEQLTVGGPFVAFPQVPIVATNGSGVFIIPTGVANSPVNTNAVAWRVTVRDGANAFDTRTYTRGNCCCDLEVWFLGDLGSFEPICLEMVEQKIDLEQTVICQPCTCYDSDQELNYQDRLGSGGKKVVKTKAMRKFSAQTEFFGGSDDLRPFLESFIKSPIKVFRYFNQDSVHRNIFIDSDSFVIRDHNDMVQISFDFFMHKDLAVQNQ